VKSDFFGKTGFKSQPGHNLNNHLGISRLVSNHLEPFLANTSFLLTVRIAFFRSTVYEERSLRRMVPLKIDLASVSEIKGFLDESEARRLYDLAREAGRLGPCLEIGSYCGKSAVFLGSACRENRTVLYSIDHHTGSEEQQPGQEYFDPDLLDRETGKIDTLRLFRKTLAVFDLENAVIPVIGRSDVIGRAWSTRLGLLFIDGSHAYEAVLSDYLLWADHVLPGGYLVFHDIFPDPKDGGQAPYLVYRQAVASGQYEVLPLFKSLGVLRKLSARS
jgi:predicted O-methyltransferase YrrM